MQIENERFPMSLESIFDTYDIPEIFISERTNGTFFQKMLSRLESNGRDQINDVRDCYNLHHLTVKLIVELNYFCTACWMEKTLDDKDGRSALIHGIFAIIYSTWDYDFHNPNIGLDSGKEQLAKYFTDDFYNSLSDSNQYVKMWVNKILNKERIFNIIDHLKKPYSDNFEGISEKDQFVIKAIRDANIYAPFYSFYFYPMVGRNFLIYELAITLLMHYNKSSLSEFDECLRKFYTSNNAHEPYLNFTKEIINEHNNSERNQNSSFLNNSNEEVYRVVFGTTDQSTAPSIISEIHNLPSTSFVEFVENSMIF